ncbi:tRNA (guanosine(46)-N7)-methyltransferase TrmB [Allobranchiibius sp. GilTou73]|uniref:tRNA (guanosine(46)-N7)-methyltransferase TrmB n=1 Tax=Allobranchiibius sp. GilTou73 TaxID=2904523 RepID=UPI001F425682|nr:tRNA (guanosine(46)-N7)-methyltransferase TrmB [Allobranchiibius sp. GilTou73]UIJ34369.1 tRNA (guanosine(46)-N7)-methyltransferase TrmB [Allobranchiibius sp. GilTou73]
MSQGDSPQTYVDDDRRAAATNRSFTRRGGRMPPRHHRALEVHGPAYLLSPPIEGTSVAAGFVLDLPAAFGRTAPLVVEIGSGSGDCVVAAAAEHPEWDFLAVEVWRPGIAQTLAKAAQAQVGNLRVLRADAAGVVATALPAASVDQLWTFFPDPWPKAKHHKRRLVDPMFAVDVVRVLRPGGLWRLATDWEDYAEQMRDVLREAPGFEPGAEYGDRFDGRVMTRFERKGIEAARAVRDIVVRRADATEQ